MPVYSVEGKLGTGKTKFAVWRAQEALLEGRRVASNVELNVEALAPGRGLSYMRVPDKPTAFDLEAIGHGNPESYDEDRNGVLILDELGTWLNARSYQDKGRSHFLDWLIHARKLGWDVFLIVQDAEMIDKQARKLIEYECKCMRLDKVMIPVIGRLLRLGFGKKAGYLPRMHMVAARVGEGARKVVAERWTFRGEHLHAAYDTRQVFLEDYPHGVFCALPTPPKVRIPWWRRLWRAVAPQPVKPARKPKRADVAQLERLPVSVAWAEARRLALRP